LIHEVWLKQTPRLDAKGIEGVKKWGYPLPSQLGGLGSVVSGAEVTFCKNLKAKETN